MNKAVRLRSLLHFSLCLLAFSIPTRFIISSICLALVVIVWLMQANFREAFRNLSERKALWPWFIYYGLLGISFFYSENKDQSLFDLKIKLAYILLPFIFGAAIKPPGRKTFEKIFIFFISGVTLAAVVCLVNAVNRYYETKYIYILFYHNLASVLDANAVYTAWYTIFSVSLLLFMPWQHYFRGRYKMIRIALIVLQVVFFFMLTARMFIILFLLFIIPYFIKKSYSNLKRGIAVTILAGVVLVAGIIAFNRTQNPIKERFDDIIHRNDEIAWLTDYSNTDLKAFDNATLRIFLWRLGIESLNDSNAWVGGLGNGDVHLALTSKMREYKVPGTENPEAGNTPGFYNANLHNMFLQALVMTGIPGLLMMLLIVFTPLFYLRRMNPYQPFLVFQITSILFMMQEAVLQTQAGIFFYILISSIFWSLYYSEKRIKNKHL